MPASPSENKSSISCGYSSLDASIDQLYGNICEMMSIGCEGEELRTRSSLQNLAGEEIKVSEKGNGISSKKSSEWSDLQAKKFIPREKKRGNSAGSEKFFSPNPDSPDLGQLMLKRARDLSAGDHHKRALDFALRAVKFFEISSNGKPCLNLVMSLHVLAAIYANLGQHDQAIAALQRSIQIPEERQDDEEEGKDQALAKFAGQMQLGDVYSMNGHIENSIACYSSGLRLQISALGAMDPRVGETCRFLAEVHLQALQLDQASELCKTALDIHRESGEDPPLEEIADLRLMGLICEIKGDHEAALENLITASSAMASIGEIHEMASLDCSIGDAFLSLARYDEAVISYRRALTGGERNPSTVAQAMIRLADLYSRMGRFRESKSHCEDALKIYSKKGFSNGDLAGGMAELAAVYEAMGEHEEAIKLLKKALKLCDGSQIAVGGIEAQIGVICYAAGDFAKSRSYLQSAVSKMRNCGEKEKRPAFLGIALNQMGLTCVQLGEIEEAARVFLEAKCILEREKGGFDPETIEICGNLAATYDALGSRWVEATRIMEHVVSAREEKLGTANPEVDGEKRRLAELLRESGRVRNRKALTLNFLFAGENGGAADKITAIKSHSIDAMSTL